MWVEVEYGTFYKGRRATGTLRLNLHQQGLDKAGGLR